LTWTSARFELASWNEVIWGLEYRIVLDRLQDGESLSIDPDRRDTNSINGFLQDEAQFFDKSLRFILGTKLGYDDFGGVNVQPSGRIAWAPNERHTVWVAASRAVRTPSRVEHDSRERIASQPGLVVAFVGARTLSPDRRPGARLQIHRSIGSRRLRFYNGYDLRRRRRARFSDDSRPGALRLAPGIRQQHDRKDLRPRGGIDPEGERLVEAQRKLSFPGSGNHQAHGAEQAGEANPRNQTNFAMDLPGLNSACSSSTWALSGIVPTTSPRRGLGCIDEETSS
jgi:hypothetical protein